MLKEEPNFADTVDKTLTTLGAAAKTVVGKFGDAKKKAQDDLKKAQAQAAKDSKSVDAQKKEKDSRSAKGSAKTPGGVNVSRAQLANFLISLDANPTIDDMAAFDDLDASQFQDLAIELSKIEQEMSDFPKEYKNLLKDSNFLTQPEKAPEALSTITQPIEGSDDALSRSIEENPTNLQAALRAVIFDPKLDSTGRVVLTWLNNRNQQNKKVNDSKSMGKNRPTGPALARIFNAYVQQVIVPRVEATSLLAKEYESKPITQEHLSAIRNLLKRL